MDSTITMRGNLAGEPTLRPTKDGGVVATLRVASTPRWYDKAAQAYREGETTFITVTCWRQLARNVVASLRRGDPVVVHGRYITRSWERDGQQHTTAEIDALAVGPDLNRVVANLARVTRDQAATPSDGSPSGAAPDAVGEAGDAGAGEAVEVAEPAA